MCLGVNNTAIKPEVAEDQEQIKYDFDSIWQLWQCQSGEQRGELETEQRCLLSDGDMEPLLLTPVCLRARGFQLRAFAVLMVGCMRSFS